VHEEVFLSLSPPSAKEASPRGAGWQVVEKCGTDDRRFRSA
jgi:hypothetical protein